MAVAANKRRDGSTEIRGFGASQPLPPCSLIAPLPPSLSRSNPNEEVTFNF